MPASAKKRAHVGPGRLSAEAAAELPDRLLDAAFKLFTEQGFAHTTMDQIAKQAGASTKTLYSRFANKVDILHEVQQRNIQRTIADHLKGFALRPEDTPPREFLLKFALRVAQSTSSAETSGLVRVTYSEAHRSPMMQRMYREIIARGENAVGNALRAWREAGALEFVGDADLLGRIFFGMTTSEPRVWGVVGSPMTRAEIERYVETGVDIFLRGLEKPNARQAAKRKAKAPRSQ